jgi:hypothetical protein
MGQLQLTRDAKDQLYNWHMDLGAGIMSLRKISMVVELAPADTRGWDRDLLWRGSPTIGSPSAKEMR